MGRFCCKQDISYICSVPVYGVKVSEQLRFIALAGVKSNTAQTHTHICICAGTQACTHTHTICKPKNREIKIDANTVPDI